LSVVVLFEGTGAEENRHRFYRSRIASGVFGDWAVIWEWDRKSSSGMLRRLWFNSEVEAVVAAEVLRHSKQQRGVGCLDESSALIGRSVMQLSIQRDVRFR
jgi:predicted DNA-binding WGR domain protein